MSPWIVLGWILVAIIATPILSFIVRLLAAAFLDIKSANDLRRANAGRLRCRKEDCKAIATRRTPKGFYCEDHWRGHQGYGAVSFAFKLDHIKQEEL